MNKKITNLIKELSLECAKEEITLSLCAFDKDGEAAVAQVGSKSSIEKSMDAQNSNWVDLLKKCGCDGCKARLAELDEDDEAVDSETQNDNDLSVKLEKFLRGEF